MKISKYAIRMRSHDDAIIFYHPISRAVVKLPFASGTSDTEILRRLSDEDKTVLREKMVLLPKEHDESLLYRYWYDHLKYSSRNLSIMYHTTFACNLACSYCYQKPVVQNVSWNPKNFEKIWEFTRQLLERKRPQHLDGCFIGGEPLIAEKYIRTMVGRIRETGIPASYLVVTNGTLLSRDLVRRLKDVGIRDYQVTIDGPKKAHDGLRVRRNGTGTFDAIIERILEVQDDCEIHLNINVSRENCASLPALFSFLKEKRIKAGIDFSMVFEYAENAFRAAIPIGQGHGEWYAVHDLAMKEGHKFAPFYRNSYGPCTFSRANYYVIGPNGDLYAYISGVGQDKYKIGSIDDPSQMEVRLSQFVERDLRDEECWKCRMLPLCSGGCFYKAETYGKKICYLDEFVKNDIPLLEKCFVHL